MPTLSLMDALYLRQAFSLSAIRLNASVRLR